MIRHRISFGLAWLAAGVLQAQNVGIGTASPHSSARLHIEDNARGLLIPNLSLSATNSATPVTGPATSLLVYNTATSGAFPNNVWPGYYYWDGTKWVRLLSGSGTVGDAWLLRGNSGTNPNINFIGTTDNTPLIVRVNGWRVYRLEPTGANQAPNIIGGYEGNWVAVGVHAATIAGGGINGAPNSIRGANSHASTIGGGIQNHIHASLATISGGNGNTIRGRGDVIGGGEGNRTNPSNNGEFATVAGGQVCVADGSYSFVGGGYGDTASFFGATVGGGHNNRADALHATIGGGYENKIFRNADRSVIAGGFANQIYAYNSAIGGGEGNRINSGAHNSVIPGGYGNQANAEFTLVFGRRINPSNESYRVYFFGPGTGADPAYSGFLVINRTDGDHPIHVGVNNSNGNGAHLTAGGIWTNGSSRTFKDRNNALDPQEVLRKIQSLPVEGWYYKGTSEYHIGPYAEDFHAAFGTGVLAFPEDGRPNPEVSKYLAASDVAGVALLGIKALAEENIRLREENRLLQERITAIEQQLQILTRERSASR